MVELTKGQGGAESPEGASDLVIDSEVLAALAKAMSPRKLPADLWARIAASAGPNCSVDESLDDGAWIETSPGVRRKRLWDDRSFLVRCEAGGAIAEHRHDQFEHCLVIKGEMVVGRRRFSVGDYHGMPPGLTHPSIMSETGVLLLLQYGDSELA